MDSLYYLCCSTLLSHSDSASRSTQVDTDLAGARVQYIINLQIIVLLTISLLHGSIQLKTTYVVAEDIDMRTYSVVHT